MNKIVSVGSFVLVSGALGWALWSAHAVQYFSALAAERSAAPAAQAGAASEAELRRLSARLDGLSAELARAKAPSESAPALPATSKEPEPARHAEPPAELPPDVQVQNDLDRLHEVMQSQAPDLPGGTELRLKLSTQLKQLSLEHTRLEQTDCFETLCRAAFRFDDLAQRDRELNLALNHVSSAFYANVPNGNALTAEVYIARDGHPLFPPGALAETE